MPAAVLVALRPLFRYSGWREAWVLRGVGERYGPVLRGRPAGSGRWPLAVVAVAAVAVLGFVVARGSGGGQPLPALDQHAASGVLRVSFPSGWRRRTAPVIPTLGLIDELALAPAASTGARLVLGRSPTSTQSLLPQTLVTALRQAPRPQVVTLGKTRFYRYLNLSPRGVRTTESVYALPTTAGTIIGACVANTSSSGSTAGCERLLATLRVPSARVLALSPSPSYGPALEAALSRLDAVRASANSRLSSAQSASMQAAAATELADAYVRAGAAVSSLAAGPATVANSAVADALERSGLAYRALARAAASSENGAYASARSSLLRDTVALQSALASLRDFGQGVS